MERITIMTVRITFGGYRAHQTRTPLRQTRLSLGKAHHVNFPGEGTPDPPLQGRHTRLSPREGTPDGINISLRTLKRHLIGSPM